MFIVEIFYGVFGIWLIYSLFFEDMLYAIKHAKDKDGFSIPIEFRGNKELFEELSSKFSYPDYKGVRYGANGMCTIEGKYGSYSIEVKDGRGYILRDADVLKKGDRKKARGIREAEVIKIYLDKHFNPNSPVDAYKVYKAFKSKNTKKFTTYAVATLVLVSATIATLPMVIEEISIRKVKDAYLTQYSEDSTIGESFNRFFSYSDWSAEGDYVYFSGESLFDELTVTTDISFYLRDDRFEIEEISVNNNIVPDLMKPILLAGIFSMDSNFDSILPQDSDTTGTVEDNVGDKTSEVINASNKSEETEDDIEYMSDEECEQIAVDYISDYVLEDSWEVFESSLNGGEGSDCVIFLVGATDGMMSCAYNVVVNMITGEVEEYSMNTDVG